MAKKGNNKTGKRPNNDYKGKQTAKRKERICTFYTSASNPVLKVIESAYQKTFWSPGHEWRGLQMEYPIMKHGAYAELNFYLDELEDEKLYEQTFRKMLKELKINSEIEWYELNRQPVPWDDENEREFLKLRAK